LTHESAVAQLLKTPRKNRNCRGIATKPLLTVGTEGRELLLVGKLVNTLYPNVGKICLLCNVPLPLDGHSWGKHKPCFDKFVHAEIGHKQRAMFIHKTNRNKIKRKTFSNGLGNGCEEKEKEKEGHASNDAHEEVDQWIWPEAAAKIEAKAGTNPRSRSQKAGCVLKGFIRDSAVK
jgi:hypothetical protein